MSLPPFPVDDQTLHLLDDALTASTGRTSVGDLCLLYSEMAGSDTTASDEDGFVTVMRDAQYSEHDILRALVTEIQRIRQEATMTRPHRRPAERLLVAAGALAFCAAAWWAAWFGVTHLLAAIRG